MNAVAQPRYFDLNIEKVLEGWETHHAVREIIANALDERELTGTAEVLISRDTDGIWHVRDFGRGLKYEHLTQNENPEKLANPTRVIGKFGVGLKDALATCDRRHIDVLIRSRFGDIALAQASKTGFADVVTLHAAVSQPSDPGFVGTDVSLKGVSDSEVKDAKRFFLEFSNETLLDETPYGHVLRKIPGQSGRIYVTGMLVAEEENFAFSYNITALTAAMRKALNRERTNVGRTAYSERVKQMLLESRAAEVADTLAKHLAKIESGTSADEVKWIDVAVHACQILNASESVLFVSATELKDHKDAIDHAQSDGLRIVTVPDNVKEALRGTKDIKGNPVRDLTVYQVEWEKSFEFKFVPAERLTRAERKVFERWRTIATLVGGLPTKVRHLKISETMRPGLSSTSEACGVWDPKTCSIVIKRTQLRKLCDFAGTLLHEIAHARSGYNDVTVDFENELTAMLGEVASAQMG